MRFKIALLSLVVLAGLGTLGLRTVAQDSGGGGRGGRGGPGGGGNFDPAQMRQRMLERLKEQLGASDDEWKVLSPKIEKVNDAQRSSRGGGFGGFGGPGGRGRGGPGGDNARSNEDQSPVSKAASDLRKALDEKSTPADDISKKLASYREARASAKDALVKAQKELKELLTARQEALLVLSGTLD